MSRPRVLVADDHAVFTEGIVRILAEHYDVVATVHDGSLVVDAVRQHRPELVVSDISMPGLSGLEALRRLGAERLSVRVVFLTMHADERLAAEALRLGAKGFVLKQASGQELVAALAAVLHGHTYLPPALTEGVLALAAGEKPPGPTITPQQRELLRLMVDGHRTKEIAARLDLSPRTVETLRYKLMRDLDLHSTAELVRFAIEQRIVGF